MNKQSPVYRFLRRCFGAAYPIFLNVVDRGLFIYLSRRHKDTLDRLKAWTTGSPADDAGLITRVTTAYRLSAPEFRNCGGSTWPTIFHQFHEDIHAAIMAGQRKKIEEILRNPASSNLFYGIESIARHLIRHPRLEDRYSPELTLDCLIALAEAVGVRRLEDVDDFGRRVDPAKAQVDEIIDLLESTFGFEIAVPNPFPKEYGIQSKRGVISNRVPHAIYLAWRISTLVAHIPNAKVLEIGAGLGRSVLYCHQFGIRNYTIIDIPLTLFAQGYFLGRVLGQDKMILAGEQDSSAKDCIRILRPQDFLDGNEHYDLIVNVDSLPEMDESVARTYVCAIQKRADAFLSINTESNDFSVRELIVDGNLAIYSTRVPYWIQGGYVEEMFRFAPKRREANTVVL